MYIYYIRDDSTGLYLIARRMMSAPAPTCVWGNRREDALTFDNAAEARKAVKELGENAVSAYLYNQADHTEIMLCTGEGNRGRKQ